MFTIGNSSGLVSASVSGSVPVQTNGDVVDNMVKVATEVPNKMLAASRVISVTDGQFSEAEESPADTSPPAEGGAAQDAAVIGGAEGGSKTPSAIKPPSDAGCEAADGGIESNDNVDQRTGMSVFGINVPMTFNDVIETDYDTLLENQRQAEIDFRNRFCVFEPYPECRTCPYRARTIGDNGIDISLLLRQLIKLIRALILGNFPFLSAMLKCPGLMNALMSGNPHHMARVAVPTGICALIGLASSRGALDAVGGIASVAMLNDYRRELMFATGDLFRSGSRVGTPHGFSNEIGGLLALIGVSPNYLVRMHAGRSHSRSTRYGPSYGLAGHRSYGRNPEVIPYTSDQRRVASPENQAKAAAALNDVKDALNNARDAASDPSSNALVIATGVGPSGSDPSSGSGSGGSGSGSGGGGGSGSSPSGSTSSKPQYTSTTDTIASPGTTYYFSDDDGNMIELTTNPGDSIDEYIAKYGTIFEKVDTSGGTDASGEGEGSGEIPYDERQFSSAKLYTGSSALVLDNGLMVQEPVFTDATGLMMAVDTRSLITKTGVLAGDMANIEGLDLTVYELKMAYLLDSLLNGSVPPADVKFQRVVTVLDELADD